MSTHIPTDKADLSATIHAAREFAKSHGNDAYCAETATKVGIVDAIIGQLCANLPGYAVSTPGDDARNYNYRTLSSTTDPDVKIGVCFDWYKARYEITGQYPKSKKDNSDYVPHADRNKKPCPTYQMARPAADVVKDMGKRFFPAYNQLVEAAKVRRAEFEAYEARQQSLQSRIAAELVTLNPRADGCDFYSEGYVYGDFTASGNSVTIKLHNVNESLAIAIAKLIAASKPAAASRN